MFFTERLSIAQIFIKWAKENGLYSNLSNSTKETIIRIAIQVLVFLEIKKINLLPDEHRPKLKSKIEPKIQIKEKCKHLANTDEINEPVELLEDGYAINGCCGGGCFVITGIKYCPFCGEKLEEKT